MAFHENLSMHQNKECFILNCCMVMMLSDVFFLGQKKNCYWQFISKYKISQALNSYPFVSIHQQFSKLLILMGFCPLPQEKVQSLITAKLLRLVFNLHHVFWQVGRNTHRVNTQFCHSVQDTHLFPFYCPYTCEYCCYLRVSEHTAAL